MATRVTKPNEGDWKKLVKMMNFLKAAEGGIASVSCDDTNSIKRRVDAALAVHKDVKSHAGATMSLGAGMIASVSMKQKTNTHSSAASELAAHDDVISKTLWTKRFVEAQDFTVEANIVYRDNASAMKLEENGKASSGKRTISA